MIGRNDIGKSSVLEALEIFFNNDVVKIDQSDANVRSDDKKVSIAVEFSDLPSEIILDTGAKTTLASEYLLSAANTLVIKKVYDCTKKNPTADICILADHPTAVEVNNLLELKEKELQALVKKRKLDVTLKGNPSMRQALWGDTSDLVLATVEIPVSKPKEDSKRIWEKVEQHLPMFALFQSDRQSKDTDGEVQNPLKGAITSAIAEVQEEINKIQTKVREKSEEIANLTHIALQTIDPKLASTLVPKFTPPTPAKWTGLFSLGMDTDDDIPLNKRGSGVRRLILVSFFKAEAERKLASSNRAKVIYAIEEPETSQHPNNQKILIEAFKEIANAPDCQVILTTHSPGLASELPADSIRFISGSSSNTSPSVQNGADAFGEIADTLGLIPDSRVKVLICVEGPTDVEAFCYLSSALHKKDNSIPDLRVDPSYAFVPLGGSSLKHWINAKYLQGLRIPEAHIYDADVEDYAVSVDEVNSRDDKLGSWAVQTNKHEIECYLHQDAIFDAFGVNVDVVDRPTVDNPSVPSAFAKLYSSHKGFDHTMKDTKAKTYLSRAFEHMTAERIRERDPEGEIEGWLRKISNMH